MTFDRILTTARSISIYIQYIYSIHRKLLQCVALLTYVLGLCAMDFNPYDVYLVVLTQRCLSHMAYPTFVAPRHRRVVRCWQRRPRSWPNQGGQPKDPQIEIWFLQFLHDFLCNRSGSAYIYIYSYPEHLKKKKQEKHVQYIILGWLIPDSNGIPFPLLNGNSQNQVHP